MWAKNGLKMSKLLAGIAGTKVEAKKVKNCEKKALSYEAPTYHNSKDRPRPFLLSFVRIKDAGEDLLSHILKLTPLVYHLLSSPLPLAFSRSIPESWRKRGSKCKKFLTTAEQLRNSVQTRIFYCSRYKRREIILRSAIPPFNITNPVRNICVSGTTKYDVINVTNHFISLRGYSLFLFHNFDCSVKSNRVRYTSLCKTRGIICLQMPRRLDRNEMRSKTVRFALRRARPVQEWDLRVQPRLERKTLHITYVN